MNPNFFNNPSARPPMPINPSSINQRPPGLPPNMPPPIPPMGAYPPSSINYPTNHYSFNMPRPNQMPYYPQSQPNQFYHPYYQQPQQQQQSMVNYPVNYMQYYSQPYQLPTATSTAASLAMNHQPNLVQQPTLVQMNAQPNPVKPVPPPTPERSSKPPPPPADKIPMPPTSSSSTTTTTNPSSAVADEYSSFLSSFSQIQPNSSTSTTISDQSVTITGSAEQNDGSCRSQNKANLTKLDDHQLNNPSNDNGRLNDPFDLGAGNQTPTTTTKSFNTPSYDNSNQSYDNSFNTPNYQQQVAKRQKLDFDENRIKSQLEQINQLKQQQPVQTPNNLMNKSQTLFTEADQHWLRLLNPEQQKLIEFLKEQQKNFEDIFKNWEDDYKEWRSKNITMLDFETYQTNLKEWEDWKTSLLNRKIKLNQTCQEKIDDLKRQILGDKSQSTNLDATPAIKNKDTQNHLVNQDQDERQNAQSDQSYYDRRNTPTDQSYYDRRNTPTDQSYYDRRNTPTDQSYDDHRNTSPDQSYDEQLEPLDEQTSSKATHTESQFCNQTALFPSSKNIIQQQQQQQHAKIKEEEDRKQRIEDACKLFDYISETREVLNIIDRLDFKVQQDRINYNHQLEYIRKTIERQSHSDSEDENHLDDHQRLTEGQFTENQFTDDRFAENQFIEDRTPQQPIHTEFVRQFDLNSVLSKMQQIKSSGPSSEHSTSSSNQHLSEPINQQQFNTEPDEHRQPVIDNDFLSKLGIDLSSVNKVLSYKDIDYFLKPPSFILNAEDLFESPAREYRPKRLCIILRGHPGSGKNNFIELVCKEEIKHRARLPRIFNFSECLINQNKMNELYTSNEEIVEQTRKVLFDDFSRVVKEAQYDFVIFNSINQMLGDFEHFYIIAKVHGYSTYIAEMDFVDYADISMHMATELTYDEWIELSRNWSPTPASYIRLKVNNFIRTRSGDLTQQNAVLLGHPSMGNSTTMSHLMNNNQISHHSLSDPSMNNLTTSHATIEDDNDDFSLNKETFFSRIDLNDSLALDKLDDNRMKLKRPVEEYWTLPHDYYQRKYSRGVRRVRWLDIELKK